jgi:hypothetical protein
MPRFARNHQCVHAVQKLIEREKKHLVWLEKNLGGTHWVKQSKRRLFELYEMRALSAQNAKIKL